MKIFIIRVTGNTRSGDAQQILASVGSDEKESRFLYVGNQIAAFLFYLIRSEARIGHWNEWYFLWQELGYLRAVSLDVHGRYVMP